jgi:uncharacterized membrane protein
MTLLVVGLMLWVAAHLFKRVVPGARADMTARMGTKSKSYFAILILVSVALIILGYRGIYDGTDVVTVYSPFSGGKHLNNLLMLVALVVYSAGMSKGVLYTRIRHPQLWGVTIWAVAHLLVRGDLAAVLLFGTMLVWAQLSIVLINRAEGPWQRPAAGAISRDLVMVAGAVIGYGVIAFIHSQLGLQPFGGA